MGTLEIGCLIISTAKTENQSCEKPVKISFQLLSLHGHSDSFLFLSM